MKTNKIVFLLLLSAFSFKSVAQNPEFDEKREKLEAQKIAYITTQLSLTPEESAAFWPIYNKMEQEKRTMMKECHKGIHEKGKPDIKNMTDDQLIKLSSMEFESQQKMLDLRKKYHQEFLKVLSIKKVMLLYEAEKDFKKELLKKLKDN
ncbi:MAG: Spy/CpxP family protein refolding chaperone [Bacteroidota bacterium]